MPLDFSLYHLILIFKNKFLNEVWCPANFVFTRTRPVTWKEWFEWAKERHYIWARKKFNSILTRSSVCFHKQDHSQIKIIIVLLFLKVIERKQIKLSDYVNCVLKNGFWPIICAVIFETEECVLERRLDKRSFSRSVTY